MHMLGLKDHMRLIVRMLTLSDALVRPNMFPDPVITHTPKMWLA